MTIPSALTLKFKIFQKVELINLCTEWLIYNYPQYECNGTHTNFLVLKLYKPGLLWKFQKTYIFKKPTKFYYIYSY